MKFLLTGVLFSFLFLNFAADNSANDETSISRVKNVIAVLNDITQVDIERRKSEEKIFSIIDRFNPQLSDEVKEDVTFEIIEMSNKYPNLNVDLLCATITHESARSWDPEVVSNAGAMGLMQIMPSTGRWLAHIEGIEWTSREDVLYNPVYNVRMGSRYLSALIETYDLDGGLAAYNGGGRRVRLWLANNKADGILWAETQNYIPSVMKLYDEFRSSAL